MSAPPPYSDCSKDPSMGMPPPQQPPIYSSQQPGYPPQQSPYPQQPQPGFPQQQGAYPQQGYPEQKYAPGPGQQAQVPYQGTTQTTIVTQPAVMPAVVMGFHESPMSMSCPCCGQNVVTSVRYDNGSMAWLLCVILCLVGLWPCACIPFCMQGCQDAIHTCPACHAQVGVYRRM